MYGLKPVPTRREPRPFTTVWLVSKPICLSNSVALLQEAWLFVAPFFAHLLAQAFGDGFRHDGVVVVVLGPVAVAEFLEADAAGDRESSDVVLQAGFLGGDEVHERAAGLAAFAVGLLAEEVEPLLHFGPRVVGVELDVVAYCIRREEAVDAVCGDQLL